MFSCEIDIQYFFPKPYLPKATQKPYLPGATQTTPIDYISTSEVDIYPFENQGSHPRLIFASHNTLSLKYCPKIARWP